MDILTALGVDLGGLGAGVAALVRLSRLLAGDACVRAGELSGRSADELPSPKFKTSDRISL